MTKTKVLGAAIIAMGALFLCSLPMAAADSPHAILQHPTYFAAGHVTQSYQPETFGLHQANPVRHIPKPYITPTPDPVVQHQVTPSSEFNPVYNVLGVGVGFPNYSVPDAPPTPPSPLATPKSCSGSTSPTPISIRARERSFL